MSANDLGQFIDRYKRALRDDRSLSARYTKRGEAANIKLLLCMLLLRYPNICPSGPTIMADCGWTDERTLTKAKRQAIEADWLEILHRGTGPGDSTVYGLKLPAFNVGTSHAGASAGTEELPTFNAPQLPTFNAEDYPHSMGDKDFNQDPNEDAKDRSINHSYARAREAGSSSMPGEDSGEGEGVCPAEVDDCKSSQPRKLVRRRSSRPKDAAQSPGDEGGLSPRPEWVQLSAQEVGLVVNGQPAGSVRRTGMGNQYYGAFRPDGTCIGVGDGPKEAGQILVSTWRKSRAQTGRDDFTVNQDEQADSKVA